MWNDGFEWLLGKGGRDFMLRGDTFFRTKQRELMAASLYRNTWHQQSKDFLLGYHAETVGEKLQDQPGGHHPRAGTYIDSESSNSDAPSLGSLAHTHFAASVFSLPLKTKEHPHGVYTEQEMYMALAVIFICIFSEIDPAKSFPLRLATKALISANREAEFFPKQDTVRTDRPMDHYIHYGFGCLGREASRNALTAMLRVVGGLDNVKRVPTGPAEEDSETGGSLCLHEG